MTVTVALKRQAVLRVGAQCLNKMQSWRSFNFVEQFLQFVDIDSFLIQEKLTHLSLYQSLPLLLCFNHF
jgi:hypothetical protein